ncbi:porin family protein [Chitinophaga japonensis]|uniref:Outer membrane protein with beta-barrel domain n=1 Tax=Chitinophaga japonensis TaxID=104662 RepID=A0A562T007_CHIJA|nr:porin family protein [Chitinophaga japonensis]TWI86822.1 outer membrane protein with beta-barrel domain [Chitinophaga japonensis]
MKKMILLTLLSLYFSATHAQTSFGILAGARNATQRVGNESSSANNKFFLLWHAGIVADIPLAGRFYLQPQLLVSRKGSYTASHNLDSTIYYLISDASGKVRMTYLELPVNVLYKFTLGAGKFVAGGGPYIAYGLGGKSKYVHTYRSNGQTHTFEQKVRFSNEMHSSSETFNKYDYYRPLDAGLNLIAGYELRNGLFFNINYSLGLTNVSPSDGAFSDGSFYRYPTAKNSYLGISLGYFLKKSDRG